MTDLDELLAFGRDDVELLERRTGWQGFFRMDVLRLRHRLFRGGWSDPIERELFVRVPAVVMLPYDPRRDELVMIEQFRVGALDTAHSPWLMEFVAGIIDTDESPEQVARREAMEEAGLAVGALEFIARYQVSPGGNTEEIILFCGEVDASAAGGIHGLDTESEDIRVHVLPVETAFEALDAGRVRNAAGIIALQWLRCRRDELRARWTDIPSGIDG